jgi:hypothetical protein
MTIPEKRKTAKDFLNSVNIIPLICLKNETLSSHIDAVCNSHADLQYANYYC